MTNEEARSILAEADAWCESCGQGPQPCTFGVLLVAAQTLLAEVADRARAIEYFAVPDDR